MKLDRNINPTGKGKYALINMRKIAGNPETPQELAAAILANPESVEFGAIDTPDEFFVIKLKDAHAQEPLAAYARSASAQDIGYAVEIERLAARSGPSHPLCKNPD